MGNPFISRSNIHLENQITVFDLFCGAGGLSEGFRQAGFKIIAGIDNDNDALTTFSNNFLEASAVSSDLSRSFCYRELLIQNVDVVIGGPPCQGFSVAGKRLGNDPRNVLYRAFIGLISSLNPSAVVVENVPTILSLQQGEMAKAIVRDFGSLGYHTEVFTLTAADYGVPQNRRRTFFVGLKNGLRFHIPAPTTAFTRITAEMAISDLPLLDISPGGEVLQYTTEPVNEYQREMRVGSEAIYNHWAVQHKQKTIDTIRLVPDGGNYKDLPEHLRDTRKVHIAWTRMGSRKPCFTIDAGHNHYFHYKADRVPTVRECARIQSFPDYFRFYGKKTSQFRQVGNAVPPLLARAIALELKETLK